MGVGGYSRERFIICMHSVRHSNYSLKFLTQNHHCLQFSTSWYMNNEIYRTFTFVKLLPHCRSSHRKPEYVQVHGIHHNFGLYPQPQARSCLMYAAHHGKKPRRRMSLDIIHEGTEGGTYRIGVPTLIGARILISIT